MAVNAQKESLKEYKDRIEQMRSTVSEMKLKADFWKAEYETKYFYLQNRNITDEYSKAYDEDIAKEKQARADMEKLMKDFQENQIATQDTATSIQPKEEILETA